MQMIGKLDPALHNGKSLYLGIAANNLVSQGIAWFDGIELVARASDGTVVNFGIMDSRRAAQQLENYLIEHPTPDTW